MTNYRNIFTYKDIKYYSDNLDNLNSEVCYLDCNIVNSVNNFKAGTKLDKIYINYILYGCDERGVVIYEEPMIDLRTSESMQDSNFNDMFMYECEINNYNLTNYEFYNCKMLIDAGDMKKNTLFEKIFVKIEIISGKL